MTDIIIFLVFMGLVSFGVFHMLGTSLEHQHETCIKMCGDRHAEYSYNAKGSSSCYCRDEHGELKLEGFIH